jgi:hypothetical protein
VGYFASREELEAELVAFLEAFLASPDGEAASAAAGEQESTVLLRAVNPEAVVSVDLRARTVSLHPAEDPVVEVELEADALHDILLERLDAVQISRLYETDRVRFRGRPEHLAALVALAGPLQPYYPATLADRGRDDLLATPVPPTKVAWGSPEDALNPRKVIGKRRPWQRPKRERAPAADR